MECLIFTVHNTHPTVGHNQFLITSSYFIWGLSDKIVFLEREKIQFFNSATFEDLDEFKVTPLLHEIRLTDMVQFSHARDFSYHIRIVSTTRLRLLSNLNNLEHP